MKVVEVSTFEAFRHDNETTKFMHCIMDGTSGTIKGSCTVVRDFANICYYSYPSYLKERRECSDQCKTLRRVCLLILGNLSNKSLNAWHNL
ncbi:hypothetical protein P8452_56260 [Trifolium repens]|nr:hypothetical protein P8452_41396 [Trifolium repens]WJX72374.1 hypothetical protein P8452_56260 [Trifolium repens]